MTDGPDLSSQLLRWLMLEGGKFYSLSELQNDFKVGNSHETLS